MRANVNFPVTGLDDAQLMVKGIQEVGEGVVEEEQSECSLLQWLMQWHLLMQERRQLLPHKGGKPGSQLPAVCGEPLQQHRDDGGDAEVLLPAKMERQSKVAMVKTQAGA